MDGLPTNLPEDPAELIALVQKQQAQLASSEKRNDRLQKKLQSKDNTIEKLEERLRALLIHRFGKRSERINPNQFTLFNEAELTVDADATDEPLVGTDQPIDVKPHSRKRGGNRKALPEHLPRVDVVHELDEHERQCGCGGTLNKIGEDVQEQLSIIPRQYFVVRHVRTRYACACKNNARNAEAPTHPLPRAQVTPTLLAHLMVSKFLDGLPLYRQEKMAAREKVNLPRAKQARWLIDGSAVFQPIINRLMDTFFSYDIALSDDTTIRVLNTEDQSPTTQSALWIRRGGPPGKPVVLVDYAASKSGEAAYGLLSEFRGTLVCDGASNFNLSVRRNGLCVALCNDHARRRFRRVYDQLSKENKAGAAGSIAGQGMLRYKALYAIEAKIKTLPPEEKQRIRQSEALPLWRSFIEWAMQTQIEGVRHAGTTDALAYLLKHANNLQTYCYDGRLPISNIESEHVAKTIAIARKNFMFADTESGAEASGRVFSLIETARANHHNPQHYLSVLLAALPNVKSIDDIDALLPWNITPEQIAERYAAFPTP
ncbi:IS66 family transposase [Granulosicoccus sp.]|nr:IS66 family transposase [Granulosicoccus sp.]MDB4222933.1 IS66 family transposase [Granulosicoccus sp.]